MLDKLQRFNVLIGAALFFLIMWRIAYTPEGLGRLAVFALAAGVFSLCAFAWKPRPPASPLS